ncbi:hypothetical protein Lal_00023705 [Lupinus albus]|nr:hypothetical protein Lal_00023705 [Lupinus albus]
MSIVSITKSRSDKSKVLEIQHLLTSSNLGFQLLRVRAQLLSGCHNQKMSFSYGSNVTLRLVRQAYVEGTCWKSLYITNTFFIFLDHFDE